MMRRRVGIWGASDESLRLLRLLLANPGVEVPRIYDADIPAALERARSLGAAVSGHVAPILVDQSAAFFSEQTYDAIVDATGDVAAHLRARPQPSPQIVTPLTARLLWGYGVAPRDRKAELLQALHEVVESVELTIETDELFERMLEIAVGVTGAEGGSLMLLDPESHALRIRVARGVEAELWPKIKVALGQGISGKVAAEGTPPLGPVRGDGGCGVSGRSGECVAAPGHHELDTGGCCPINHRAGNGDQPRPVDNGADWVGSSLEAGQGWAARELGG